MNVYRSLFIAFATGTVSFEKQVTLAPKERRTEEFTPAEFHQLTIDHPAIWWPTGLGEQKLHQLSMRFALAGVVSDDRHSVWSMEDAWISRTRPLV